MYITAVAKICNHVIILYGLSFQDLKARYIALHAHMHARDNSWCMWALCCVIFICFDLGRGMDLCTIDDHSILTVNRKFSACMQSFMTAQHSFVAYDYSYIFSLSKCNWWKLYDSYCYCLYYCIDHHWSGHAVVLADQIKRDSTMYLVAQ